MPKELTLRSPAKVNLFLRVIRRRSDGYHELASLFQAIDLCDLLHFRVAAQDLLTCTDPSLPTDETNLVNQAVRLFRSKTGLDACFAIHLEKRVPQLAGLGGGSSNAATTLWALNHLCGRPASEAQLMAWGSEIGSDVSFFLSQGTAYCTGRGEVVRPLSPLPQKSLLIVKPRANLSTPQVYGRLNAAALPQRDPEVILANFNHNPLYFNDLEFPAFEILPELAELKKRLQSAGYSTVLMSGSGTSFFCLGEGRLQEAEDVLNFCPVHFLNRETDKWF